MITKSTLLISKSFFDLVISFSIGLPFPFNIFTELYINIMQELLNYFETIPTLHRSIILVGGITFFWILEGNLPLFNFNYKKWKHAIPNFFFTITTILINFILAFLLVNIADWVTLNEFGLLYIFNDLVLL